MTAATIVLDLFPVHIDTPDGGFDQARVITDGSTAWAFRANGPNVIVIGTLQLVEPPVSDVTHYEWQDAEGTVWKVVPGGGGCGCGSPMRRLTAETLIGYAE